MRDWLLELGSRPAARRLVGRLGLPLPMPQKLNRGRGPWEARPLADQIVVVGGGGNSPWMPALAKVVAGGGAYAAVASGAADPFRALGEAYGRPASSVDVCSLPDGFRAHALLFDATGLRDVTALRTLYDFFHPLIPALRACGRAVVLGQPAAEAPTAAQAAVQGALEGFVRSLAKEIGRRGSTATLVLLGADAAPAHLEPVLGFLLSSRSAFVTAQPLTIDGDGRVPALAEAPLVRPLERQIAVVTGAARGIGRAIAERMAEEGAHVVCIDRPADDVAGGRVARAVGGSFLAVDVSDEGAAALIATHLRQQHGGVDVVVHNAGITRDRTLARMSPEAWDDTLDINLGAPMRIDQALLDQGLLRSGGRIICLASVAGIAGNVGQTNYAASKAGVAAYVRRRAAELVGRGITANAVAPGLIETRMTEAMPALVREAGRRLSALGQGGQPVDVAEVVTFLASPGAAGLNGTVLRVCGGALMGA